MLVEKSLRNLATDGVLAQVHEHWPLTLNDLDVRFLRALAPLMPSLSEKAIGFHGEPGAGKNPVARLPWLCPNIGSRKLTKTLRSLHPFAKPRNLISSVARVAPSFDLTFSTMAPSANRCWQHREYVKRKMGCRQVG